MDDARFEVVGSQLQLKAGQSIDFETEPMVPINVTSTDSDGASVMSGFTVNVTDQNDEAPVITNGQTFVVSETAAATTVVGNVTATDADAGTTFSNWTITGGNTDGVFTIDSTTGELSVVDNTNLDFENTPTYTLTITVDDGVNTSTAEAVSISVSNVNDSLPVISGGQSFSVSENSSNGTSVGTIAASDPDGPSTTFSNWTITGGNPGGVFTIDSSTGELAVANTASLDFETTPSYSLSITVSDGVNTSLPESVTITVLDASDSPPVANPDSYSVDEGSTLNVAVLPNWFNSNWSIRQQLSIDNTSQTSDLIDQPILVKLHASASDAVAIDYSQTLDAGEDLRFVDADGTVLAHEIELWDEAGYSYVWVNVPQIDGLSSSDFIWVYYGNSQAADGQNASGVWNGDERSVLHFNNFTTDSTAFQNDGQVYNAFVGNGVVAGAALFDGSSSAVIIPSDPTIDDLFIGGGTISAWINPSGWGEAGFGRIADKADTTFGGNGSGWAFQVGGSGASG